MKNNMVVGQLNLEDDNDDDDDDDDAHQNEGMLVKFQIYLMKKEALNLTQP